MENSIFVQCWYQYIGISKGIDIGISVGIFTNFLFEGIEPLCSMHFNILFFCLVSQHQYRFALINFSTQIPIFRKHFQFQLHLQNFLGVFQKAIKNCSKKHIYCKEPVASSFSSSCQRNLTIDVMQKFSETLKTHRPESCSLQAWNLQKMSLPGSFSKNLQNTFKKFASGFVFSSVANCTL